eukprot:TRINITY_DN4060_c0_g1_i1.p1 TRINITY_DN4060_c0_g1~~TRINITY_DN4060_c0_g1_i1.p1  ORF type:complete len:301 (+),score=43.47 TRINITY_DN4060_c0_g1_i1:113-1015(+)
MFRETEGTAQSVAETNDDATECKCWAAKIGYFNDDFVKYFVPGNVTRKPPLISRGYHTRVFAIRALVDQFLAAGGSQIVNLGAGFDTIYFRLKQSGVAINYYELDFPHVVKKKISIILKTPQLRSLVPTFEAKEDGTASGDGYHLIGGDLKNLPNIETLLVQHQIVPTRPTLFLSECVLIYVNTHDSSQLIQWTTSFFSDAMFIIYEQILPNDPFGKMMVTNLEERGVPLTSLKKYPDLASQKKRMTDLGYLHVEALNMLDICRRLIGPEENRRYGIFIFTFSASVEMDEKGSPAMTQQS